MNSLRSSWFPVLLGLIIFVVICSEVCSTSTKQVTPLLSTFNIITEEWQASDSTLIASLPEGEKGEKEI